MPTVRYTSFAGEIVGENRAGVKRDYVPDPLGSTVALLDNAQTKTDTFIYWPYGEERSRTGTTATPMRFAGGAGYFRDSATKVYVRARHLQCAHARWLTSDPLWWRNGRVKPFCYVLDRPLVGLDPSGLAGPIYGKCCGPQDNPWFGKGDDSLDQCCCNHDQCWRQAKPIRCNVYNQFLPQCALCTIILCWCFRITAHCADAKNFFACLCARNTFKIYACGPSYVPP
jgi:RHS repeat-associated protein